MTQEQRNEQELRLEKAVANARELRAEFRRLYADAIKTLGRFCEQVDTAVSARNVLAVGYADPLRDTMLADICNVSALQVLDTLCDEGYGPVLSYGWNFSFMITPQRGKEHTNGTR